MTGDPSREAWFGPYWNRETQQAEALRIPFNQFQFPACDNCNSKYSELEGAAKGVVTKILGGEPLAHSEIALFLSWLDKVRIGLWLGIFYLHRPLSDIEPHMFIESRLDLTDRAVFIYRSSLKAKRLNFAGIDTPAFQYMPSCWTLLVNNYAFFNLATDFLISRRLGLPYPQQISWQDWPVVGFDMVEGIERVNLPLIRKSFNTRCTQLYQPIYSRPEIRGLNPDWWETEYVRSVSADHVRGMGKVFLVEGRDIDEFPEDSSVTWLPDFVWSPMDLDRQITRQTYRFQLHMLDTGPDHRGLDRQGQIVQKAQYQFAREYIHRRLRAIGV